MPDDTQLMLTPMMWMLFECMGFLAHDAPFSPDWLPAILDPEHRQEARRSIQWMLDNSGVLERAGKGLVKLSVKGRQYVEAHPGSPDFLEAAEAMLLMASAPLIDREDGEGLKLFQPHLWVATYRAMPRADERAVMLAMTLFLCLTHTRDLDQARVFARDVQSLEKAIGQEIIPPKARQALAQAGETITLGMQYILQGAVFLAPHGPVPQVILKGMFDPRSEAEEALRDLITRGFLQQPDPQTVLPTERGASQFGPPDEELKEGILAGLLNASAAAVKRHDREGLKRLQPHLKALADEAISQQADTTYQLARAMVECLVALGQFEHVFEYMDAIEELEAESQRDSAPGDDEVEVRDLAQVLNYHGQAGLHYYLKEDFQRAHKHFERAIRAASDPATLAHLHKKLGECCRHLLDSSGEIRAFGAALDYAIQQHGADSWETLMHRSDLAQVLIRYGQLDAAARQMHEALALSDAKPLEDVHFLVETAKATLLLADILYRQGDKQAGRKLVERCLNTTQRIGKSWNHQIMLFYSAASLLYGNDDLDLAQIPLAGALDICLDLPDTADREAMMICDQARDLARLLDMDPPIPGKDTRPMHFLRRRREELGLSQSDLALRLVTRGVKLSRVAIGNWERGKRQPVLSKRDLEALADALHWNVEQLVEAMSEAQD